MKAGFFNGLCLFIMSVMLTGAIYLHLAFSTRRDYNLLKKANATVSWENQTITKSIQANSSEISNDERT